MTVTTMQELTEEQRRELEERLKAMSPEELREYQKRQCIFCRMVTGEIPAKKIYEDDQVFAVMDINPAAAGHLLLLPKEHYMLLQQMPDDAVGHLFLIARQLTRVFLQSLRAEGSTVFVASGAAAGQRAQHVIVHLIPRKEEDTVGLKPKPLPARASDLDMVAKALRPFCQRLLAGTELHPEKEVPESQSPQATPPDHDGEATDKELDGGEDQTPSEKHAIPATRPPQPNQTKPGRERSSLDDIADFLSKP